MFNITGKIPRLLTECGHTICSSCVAILLKGAQNGTFECPEDKTLCGLGKKKPDDFPKNLSLMRLLEKQGKPAPEKAPVKQESECEKHKRKFEIVCIDCKMRLCSKCAIFGGHRNHDLRSEEELISEIAMRGECLQEMLQLINDNEQIFTQQEELKSSYEKCIAREKEIHTLIELRFQDYFEALKSKKTRVIQCLANIAQAVEKRFSGLKEAPRGLSEKVASWKKGAKEKLDNLQGDGKTEAIAFELLENKENKAGDILFLGGQLLEELAQLKTDLALRNVSSVLENWTASFDDKFKAAINKCCVIKHPFEVQSNCLIPEDEASPTALEAGDLLNESLSIYEGDFLASISPGKRQSIAQPAAELKRYSFMPSNEVLASSK